MDVAAATEDWVETVLIPSLRDYIIPLVVWLFMVRFLFREARGIAESGVFGMLRRAKPDAAAAGGNDSDDDDNAERPQNEAPKPAPPAALGRMK